jgi:hypothetical protein
MKGLLVDVYKFPLADCTNGGVTGGTITKAVLIGPGLPKIFEPSADAPALFVQTRGNFPTIAVPEQPDANGRTQTWWMAGGNFVYTSDSRYREAIGWHPIAVHDRRDR